MALTSDDISALYSSHARALLRFLTRRTLTPDVAVDLLAETFATAFAQRASFRGSQPEEALAWLYGIARNLAAAYHRRGIVEQRAVQRLGVQRRDLSDEESDRIEQLAEVSDLRPLLVAALAELSEEQRRAVSLRVVGELEYEEIARRTNVSEQTARARVSRGLRALAVSLGPEGLDG